MVFDSRKARNGGLVFQGGGVYRVNQVQGMNHYGAGFSVNEILELNEDRYSEKKLVEITPDFFDGITSTHHFHFDNSYSVVDFAEATRSKK